VETALEDAKENDRYSEFQKEVQSWAGLLPQYFIPCEASSEGKPNKNEKEYPNDKTKKSCSSTATANDLLEHALADMTVEKFTEYMQQYPSDGSVYEEFVIDCQRLLRSRARLDRTR